MCGRFSLGVDTDALVAEFGLPEAPAWHAPRFNIAPTQAVTAVVRASEGLRVGTLRWGLVPGGGAPGRGPLINARAETVARLPSFAASFHRRRCWILADGFYEWRRGPDGSRTPYHIRLPGGRPFALAGLWDRGTGEQPGVPSCAILTTRAAPAVAPVHDRMPVMLDPTGRHAWLDPAADADALEGLLAPWSGPLELTRVSARVNSVAHDDPACLEPVPDPGETSVL